MDKETINRIQTYLKKSKIQGEAFYASILVINNRVRYGIRGFIGVFCIYLPKFATLFGIVFGVLPVAVFVVLMIKSLIKPKAG